MRILVVSAHFPPNFVSGGTLAPQRLARGLRARSHDVSVYAGYLDGERPALATWTDTDDTGLSVRWIVTTPWTGWSDRHNFDNPEVVADFAAHAAAVQPDVIHVHSVQTLGAGLLPAAAATGAKVVLTMHDFWWFCARQFLVSREYQPCSLVVDCGGCPCEVDRPWLDDRNRGLREQLRHVDLVLAPSPSAARVFAANGLPEAKLRVDENGLPEADRAIPRRPAAPAGGPVRFRYTGGWNEMKGAHIVVAAAHHLAAEVPAEKWQLVAHDLAPYLDANAIDRAVLPLEVAPAFGPHETDAIFAATDVLVVPSVMRESHSIVTREALTRGVPVITTDTLGPEEVVDHGQNGLVVPAADAAALAAAMARVVSEPGLLDHLRSHTGRVPIRSLAEQVLGLEALYREVLEPPAPVPAEDGSTEPAERDIRRVLFVVGITGAPLRYRARLPAEALHLLGVHTDVRYYRDLDVTELADAADAVVVYRVPATRQVLDLIGSVRRRGVPVVFDVDDLIFDPDLAAEIPALSILPPDEARLWLEGVRRYRTTMEACDAFVGSTTELCRHATAVSGLPAHRFANGVGRVLARLSEEAATRPRQPGPPRLAYFSGTDTHDHDWAAIEPAVVDALGRHPDAELWLVGLIQPSPALDPFAARLRRVPFTPWSELPGLLRDVDINLAPLASGSRFNEAKSAIKWLEAALVGTPTIASPTEPFREAIEPGVNGILATTTDEWASAIEHLLQRPDERARLGQRARRDALLRWSPHLQGRRYLDILSTVSLRDESVASTWEPVVHDEPPVASPLDAYDEVLGDDSPPLRLPVSLRLTGRRLRAARRQLVVTWRREGGRATVGKVVRRVRQRVTGVS